MRAGAAAGLEAADALLRREGPAVPAAAHQEPDRKHPAHVPGGYYIYIYIYIYIIHSILYRERDGGLAHQEPDRKHPAHYQVD